MANQTQAQHTPDDQAKERAAKAKKVFDDDEAKAKSDPGPWTSQVDQLRRSAEMEEVGVSAWMDEQERRIKERQGDPPAEPRQVHGIATPKPPAR